MSLSLIFSVLNASSSSVSVMLCRVAPYERVVLALARSR